MNNMHGGEGEDTQAEDLPKATVAEEGGGDTDEAETTDEGGDTDTEADEEE